MGKTTKLAALATTVLLASTVTHAKTELTPVDLTGFTKLDAKASFIHGENLITDSQYALPTEADLETSVEKRAEAMGVVMVTRNGDQYESKMSVEDLKIFEDAIAAVEKNLPASKLFYSPGYTPLYDPIVAAPGGELDQTDGVVGADGRTRVYTTTSNPYKNIGRISLGCTGTLVGPRHVLTAGHCVSDGRGNWYSSLDFSAGQNGSTRPWGQTSWSNAYTVSQWHNNRDSRYDYGMIILSSAPHGGYGSYANYSGGTHTVTGYPGDKPYGTMWTMSGSTWSDSYKIYYSLDTAGGQSGSGIRDTGNTVRGIHAYGYGSYNGGTRITSTVYSNISSWINAN